MSDCGLSIDGMAREMCGCSWCASGLDMCREGERREEMRARVVSFASMVRAQGAATVRRMADAYGSYPDRASIEEIARAVGGES